jgi:hypothetical protein
LHVLDEVDALIVEYRPLPHNEQFPSNDIPSPVWYVPDGQGNRLSTGGQKYPGGHDVAFWRERIADLEIVGRPGFNTHKSVAMFDFPSARLCCCGSLEFL